MDRFEISMLRDLYGELLTKRQDEVLRMRYDEDLSFGEIAEILEISRAAVLDTLNKAEKHLEEFENALKCLAKQRKIDEILSSVGENSQKNELLAALKSVESVMEE